MKPTFLGQRQDKQMMTSENAAAVLKVTLK
jgi:hypothetical protein